MRQLYFEFMQTSPTDFGEKKVFESFEEFIEAMSPEEVMLLLSTLKNRSADFTEDEYQKHFNADVYEFSYDVGQAFLTLGE